ncbi:uncharacterized protein [Venturia canescens]|uniref:uncharacterized protein isoform X2 n=1 Tax=Venturia canescens TaxID=32260 RepID=UPI001C9C6009|nr:uncharacterized protein LOC122407587 isoform X2 [Venturia canescens]
MWWCSEGPPVLRWTLLFAIAGWTITATAEGKNENYKMSNVCKHHFMNDLYRKIDGAVLTSQNERNLDCAITFQTHSILQRFMLRFDRLQLDCNDHLYIYDGAHAVDNFKADLSCKNTNVGVGAIYTRTNFVTLKYVTDGWGMEANGFRLVITAIKDQKHTCKDFRCKLNEFCIGMDLLCDGVNHCEDGSDESASTLCANTEASTILGMQTTWFAVILVLSVLSMAGSVAATILCYSRHRVTTPRHPHNAHNAQPHPPVSFPCCWSLSPRSLEEGAPIMTSQNLSSRRRRFACPRCLIGLGLLSIFSIITTTLLGNAISQSLDDNSILQDFDTGSSSNNNSIQIGYHEKDYFIGPCLIHSNKSCPDEEVTFFLYTRNNPFDGEEIRVNGTWSNLNEMNYSKNYPTKIIIHGYNSDMQLDSLVDIRIEYLKKEPANLIAVDWHRLAVGPCYPVAVHNVPHVGDCLAQLIERLRDAGTTNIHVIGFSLGAHVPAFSANVLKPYKIPRITGLDPAMPLFVTVGNDGKLDAGDAEFVDVFHTNAFIQGKVETSGHIDFYMNGGINQPGCWQKQNPFGCNHHRSAAYFAESINTRIGFWGWPCPGLVAYLLGLCPPRFPAVVAGDNVDTKYRGFFLVKTRAEAPFALGPFSVSALDAHM